MRAMPIIVVTFVILGCAGPPNPFQPTIDQGLVIMKNVNFESSPEAKLQTARELLAHAEQYARQVLASSPSDTRREAERLRRGERATASILMRDAASDYVKQQQPAKARDTYRSILATFTEEYEQSFRDGAEAALRQLEEGQAK
jgi:bacterioferritin (cytochrome b1)